MFLKVKNVARVWRVASATTGALKQKTGCVENMKTALTVRTIAFTKKDLYLRRTKLAIICARNPAIGRAFAAGRFRNRSSNMEPLFLAAEIANSVPIVSAPTGSITAAFAISY